MHDAGKLTLTLLSGRKADLDAKRQEITGAQKDTDSAKLLLDFFADFLNLRTFEELGDFKSTLQAAGSKDDLAEREQSCKNNGKDLKAVLREARKTTGTINKLLDKEAARAIMENAKATEPQQANASAGASGPSGSGGGAAGCKDPGIFKVTFDDSLRMPRASFNADATQGCVQQHLSRTIEGLGAALRS